jgi:predicted Fe-S protein YdhL (DUF1289 family)
MTAAASGSGAASSPVSPCIGICLMDPATRTCRGCLRTIDEIAGWYQASIADKQAILVRLAVRRREADRR